VPVAVGLSLRLVPPDLADQLADVLLQEGVEDLQADADSECQQSRSGVQCDLLERHRHLLVQAHSRRELEPCAPMCDDRRYVIRPPGASKVMLV
jgi:hypothetical protein